MANARLTSIELERFKSYDKPTRIELAPLTVLLGRNNSGKSTLIQALLLLKQTLALPRPEVPLHLEGMVDALSLRELTYGWPSEAPEVPGPVLKLQWESTRGDSPLPVETQLELEYAELNKKIILKRITLRSGRGLDRSKAWTCTIIRQRSGEYEIQGGEGFIKATELDVRFDHFIPYVHYKPDSSRNISMQLMRFQQYFSEPLYDLKRLLTGFFYLGSMRTSPPSLYRAATVPPEDIGVSGEYAAQMLHSRRADVVHHLPSLQVRGDDVIIPDTIRSQSLEEGLNDVLRELGVDTALKIEDVKDFGFRLLFGQASIQHVGRGLSYLLPVIQLGLMTDPLRFQPTGPMSLAEYRAACAGYGHLAFEEPEVHLHPKVQSRLAHWLVALAMAQRRLIVETHSDHLVRRLRGLAARAKRGSELERWLLDNVRILYVEQRNGQSEVQPVQLTPQGGMEQWPTDFMDEATDEERSIYHASLDKEASPAPAANGLSIEHDAGEEPELAP